MCGSEPGRRQTLERQHTNGTAASQHAKDHADARGRFQNGGNPPGGHSQDAEPLQGPQADLRHRPQPHMEFRSRGNAGTAKPDAERHADDSGGEKSEGVEGGARARGLQGPDRRVRLQQAAGGAAEAHLRAALAQAQPDPHRHQDGRSEY